MSELFYRWVLPLSAAGALAVLACLALTPLLNKLRPAARARALAAAFPFFLVPVGAVLFIGAKIGGVSIEQASLACIPFWIAVSIVVLAIIFIPELTLWLPSVFG